MSKKENKTPWAVLCQSHGRVFLSKEEYHSQMMSPNKLWACTKCGRDSSFDDDNFESYHESGEGGVI